MKKFEIGILEVLEALCVCVCEGNNIVLGVCLIINVTILICFTSMYYSILTGDNIHWFMHTKSTKVMQFLICNVQLLKLACGICVFPIL